MRIQKLDLRGLSYDPGTLLCKILLPDRQMQEWIVCGRTDIRNEGQFCWVAVPLRDAYDFEHDTAYVLRIPLIGLQFEYVSGHTTVLRAGIHPRRTRDFRVPEPGYNPLEHPETRRCGECKDEHHLIVPEKMWMPPENDELQREMAGEPLFIHIGPVIREPEPAEELSRR